jgi:hypothetical protein
MKEDQFGEDIYLNEYTEYDKTTLHQLFGELYDKLDKAEQSGFKGVFVQFRSTTDPYETYAGPVEVQVRGQRGLNMFEKAEEEEQKRIEALSRKLGVTFYEASVVDRLEKAKKVKL